MIKILIDSREQALLEACMSKMEYYPHISIQSSCLDLGDIEIYDEETLLFVWERKTLSDLLSSLRDNRYSEQSHRLFHVHGSAKVVYLIEGILNTISIRDWNLVISTMTSLSFFKGFHVWRSISVHDSADILLASCDKISRDLKQNRVLFHSITAETNDDDKKVDTSSYTHLVKKVKHENITRDNISELFLCQIPDIHSKNAKAILDTVQGDIYKLIEMIREHPETLQTIQVPIGKDKYQKISKKVVSQLISFLGNP